MGSSPKNEVFKMTNVLENRIDSVQFAPSQGGDHVSRMQDEVNAHYGSQAQRNSGRAGGDASAAPASPHLPAMELHDGGAQSAPGGGGSGPKFRCLAEGSEPSTAPAANRSGHEATGSSNAQSGRGADSQGSAPAGGGHLERIGHSHRAQSNAI
jgi:hypothetical protein